MTQKITDQLKSMAVPIADLIEDPANARKHDARNLAAISNSLRRFGQVEPLVVQKSTMQVIGGNGRLTAMKALDWQECSVVFLDIDNSEAAALGITLNRSSELGEWDLETLGTLLESLDEEVRVDVGFTSGELENLLKAEWDVGDLDAPSDVEEHSRAPEPPPGEDKAMGATLFVDEGQHETLQAALVVFREAQNGARLTMGTMLQHLCEKYLSANQR